MHSGLTDSEIKLSFFLSFSSSSAQVAVSSNDDPGLPSLYFEELEGQGNKDAEMI